MGKKIFIVLCLAFLLGTLTLGAVSAKEAKINILTAKMGGAGYVMSFALVDIMKKADSWVKMKGIETTGIAENLKTLVAEPERRKNTVIFCNAATPHQAKVADPPYSKPYTSLRFIALFNPARHFFVTLDSNLKTPKDLAGKKVGIFPRGSSGVIVWQALIEYGFGVKRKDIDWVYLPPGAGLNAVADGRLHATWALSSPPPLNAPIPPLQKLMSQKKNLHFLAFSKEAAKAAREKTGYPIYVAPVPAGTYTPNQPDLSSHVQFLSWWADLAMDEDIAYEIAKTIYENVEKFARYHALGKTMTKTSIAQAVTEDMFHPGAQRFYREKGVKMGAE